MSVIHGYFTLMGWMALVVIGLLVADWLGALVLWAWPGLLDLVAGKDPEEEEP